MKYFFILGNNPTLSIAELTAVFGSDSECQYGILSEQVFLIEIAAEIDAKELIEKIGGTIKIGQVIAEVKSGGEQAILTAIKKYAPDEFVGKFNFGYSNYSRKNLNLKVLGMEFKKLLSGKNISARWVTSKEKVLSSVVVEQNKMIDKGREFVILPDKDKLLIGSTLAVQPFKELSFRDYGRPARDDYSGLLPPKLAQIMINLASAGYSRVGATLAVAHERGASREGRGKSCPYEGIAILDPFCGSGTILTEAMLMGFANLIGADISAKAIEDTKKNIEWIRTNYELRIMNYELFNKNILELSNFIAKNSIDAIVTEPYLGPQRGKVDFARVKKELEDLYSRSLVEFHKVLKPNGRVVMVWPVFNAHNTQHVTQNILEIDINNFKIISPIPENLLGNKIIRLTNRNTIIYGRLGQKVWREIVVLEKK